MSTLLVVALIIASILVILVWGESPGVKKAAHIGGFAFILYGMVLGLIYLMGLVKGG